MNIKDLPHFAADTVRLALRHVPLYAAVLAGFYFADQHFDEETGVMFYALVSFALTEMIALGVNRFRGKSENRSSAYIRKWRKWLDLVFYISFAFIYFERFLETTMFKYIFSDHEPVRQVCRTLGYLCMILAVLETSRTKSVLKWLLQTSMLLLGLLCYQAGGQRLYYFIALILIVAAAGKSFRIIAYISVFEGLSASVFAYIASMRGVIGYFATSSVRNGVTVYREALGNISPTDAAAHLLFIVLAWCSVRKAGRRWRNYADDLWMTACTFIAWHYNGARVSSALLMAAIALTALYQAFKKPETAVLPVKPKTAELPMKAGAAENAGAGKKSAAESEEMKSGRRPAAVFCAAGKRAVRILADIVSLSYVIFAAWSYYMMRLPDEESVWIPMKNVLVKFMDLDTLYSRIRYSQEAYQTLPVRLLGTVFDEVGWGGGRNYRRTYFFLDNSFVRTLFAGGILIAVLYIAAMTYIMFYFCRRHQYYFVLILAIAAADCLFEHHMTDFCYNIFPMMLFSMEIESGARRGRSLFRRRVRAESENTAPRTAPEKEDSQLR